MTRQELWDAYIKRNPHWLTDNVTLPPEGLRKLVEQTYDLGYKQGQLYGKGKDMPDNFNDILKSAPKGK